MKWLIQAQIDQMQNGGTVVDTRAGNLNYTWPQSDFESDGTHPNKSGETKVGTMLLDFFKTSTHSRCWFLAGQSC